MTKPKPAYDEHLPIDAFDLERNDIAGAVNVYAYERATYGKVTPDTAHVLVRLQDDPDAYARALWKLFPEDFK